MGVGNGEAVGQSKFRVNLEDAVRSAAPGVPVDPAALSHCLELVRGKECSAGEALSCFKHYFKQGTPDEQFHALLVLQQFVEADPSVSGQLHAELASKRWRERLVVLAHSCPHPAVKPQLVAMLSAWQASYRNHDIGLHYGGTLREIQHGSTGSFGRNNSNGRYSNQQTGASYNPQQTGYSTQHTGYSTMGYPPGPAGYGGGPQPPPGYPPVGYPPAPVGFGSYPAPSYNQAQTGSRRMDASSAANKLGQLNADAEMLRASIREAETALADYKAGRAPFAVLSSALERGARVESRIGAAKTSLEELLGSSELTDEGLTSRILTALDGAVPLQEQWNKLANQELGPDDATAASTSGPAAPAAAAAAASPPLASKPAPSPLDLLLGDEVPLTGAPGPAVTSPTADPFAHMAPAAVNAAALLPANGFYGGAQPPPPPLPPAAHSQASSSAAAPPSLFVPVAAGPVVPATTVEGLRAQVLNLGVELDKQRRLQQTSLEAQEAFHRSEMAQVKSSALARVNELTARNNELEATVARLQQQLAQLGQPAAGGNVFGMAMAAPPPPPPPPAPAAAMPYGAGAGAPGMSLLAALTAGGGGGSAVPVPAANSNNPFASMLPPPAASAAHRAPAAAPLPPPSVPAQQPAGPVMFDAFDELAAATSLRSSAGGSATIAQQPMVPAQPKPAAPANSNSLDWVNFGQ